MPKVVDILKNILIWFIGVICLIVPILLLLIWKTCVILTAKVLRPSLRPFAASDLMTLSDAVYKKPLINIGLILKFQGNVDIGDLRTHFAKCLLDPKDARNQPRNMNLFSFIVRYGGYCFNQRVSTMNLENQIYQAQLNERESFSDFVVKFMYAPYQEGEPFWNVCLLPGIDIQNSQKVRNDSVSTLLFRLHHSMGDGYSLLYLFDQLTQRSTADLGVNTSFQESFRQKVGVLAGAPVTLQEFATATSKIPNPFPMSEVNTDILYSFFTLDLESVKRVRRRTGAHVISILLTLLGGVLRRLLIEQRGQKEAELPEHIYTAHSLPWPSHPRNKLCNEWTVGIFKVPIQNGNGLERLRETEKNFNEFHEKGINKIIKRLLLPIAALLPMQIFDKTADADAQFSTSWAAIVGGDKYSLLGNTVTNIYPFVGFTLAKMTMVSISLSHSNQIDVTLAVNKEFVTDPATMNRAVNILMPKELESLITLAEALS